MKSGNSTKRYYIKLLFICHVSRHTTKMVEFHETLLYKAIIHFPRSTGKHENDQNRGSALVVCCSVFQRTDLRKSRKSEWYVYIYVSWNLAPRWPTKGALWFAKYQFLPRKSVYFWISTFCNFTFKKMASRKVNYIYTFRGIWRTAARQSPVSHLGQVDETLLYPLIIHSHGFYLRNCKMWNQEKSIICIYIRFVKSGALRLEKWIFLPSSFVDS